MRTDAARTISHWIGGKPATGTSTRTGPVWNPATGQQQAEVLLGEDAPGVVQILGEVRDAEITRYLLQLASRAELETHVRARAIGAIEADQTWERDELAKLAHKSELDESLRIVRLLSRLDCLIEFRFSPGGVRASRS